MEYLIFLLFPLVIWGMWAICNWEAKINYNDYVKNHKYDPEKTYSTNGKPIMSFDEFKRTIINGGGMS